MGITDTVIDGSRILLEGPINLSRTPSTFAYGRSHLGTHEFAGGDQAYAGHVVQRDQAGFTVLEQYAYQGGELLLGVDLLVDPVGQTSELRRTAIWRGSASSFKFFIHGGESSDLVAIIDLFDISESKGSVTLAPKDSSKTPFGNAFRPSGLFKSIPDLGMVDVLPLTRSSAGSVPNWSGKEVEGGELFKGGHTQEDLMLFLLGETSLTRIYPDPELETDQVIETASKLLISWENAS